MKILIADDDLSMRFLLSDVLAGAGHDVITTSNGSDALEAIHALKQPFIAILDWMLPFHSGVELCQRIRSSCNSLPHYVFIITGRSGSKDREDAMAQGADEFLAKPFDLLEFKYRIESVADELGRFSC